MFGWLSLKLNWICSWSLDMMLWYLSFFERCLCTKTLSVDSVTDCSEAARQLSMVSDTASFISKWWRNSVRKGYFNRKCIYKWNPDGANKRKVFVFYINYHWINRYEMVCNTNARDTPTQKMKILSSFTHSRVDPNRHCISFSCGAQRKCLKYVGNQIISEPTDFKGVVDVFFFLGLIVLMECSLACVNALFFIKTHYNTL